MDEKEEIIITKEDSLPNKVSYKKVIIYILTFIIFFVASYEVFYLTKIIAEKREAGKILERDKAYYDSLLQENKDYYNSLLKNNPSGLQNSFVEDIKNGVNNEETKSAIYFITHRFFDNNGDIYEIYNYVESHPELAFLKEAELIYPDIFEQIRNKKLPSTYTYSSFYAYLAYVEVLNKYGYADVATLATAANQYAGNLYFKTVLTKEMEDNGEASRLKDVSRDLKKSVDFLNMSSGDVEKILDGKLTSADMPARDILVGLNQYASALRYLEALGVKATSTNTSREVFAFAMDYSARFVLELNIFTSLVNASTLAILDSSTSEEIKIALSPILSFDTKKPNSYKGSVIKKIIQSRFEQKPAEISRTRLDIYSKRSVLLNASKVPEFKAWLMSNGWGEADFK